MQNNWKRFWNFEKRYFCFLKPCGYRLYDWDVLNAWLGCYEGMTGVLDEDIINEGVIDTIEQWLQRYDDCMYYIVDCVWLGCPKFY